MTDNFRASLLMVMTMAGFSVQDLLIKMASGSVPIGQITMTIGLIGTITLFVLACWRGQPLLHRGLWNTAFVLRFFGELFGCLLVFKALALLPLSTATAIGQAAPIVTTIGAAIFLREIVGWRRWTAAIVGMLGVVLVLQPGPEGIQPAALLALASVVAFAARDLATRRMPPGITTWQATFWGYVAVLPGSFILIWADDFNLVLPTVTEQAMIVVAAGFGVGFYWTLTVALQIGEASVVGPLRYTRIVFALILATLVLGERLQPLMMLGLVLVIGSGLYTVLREARLRRRRAASLTDA